MCVVTEAETAAIRAVFERHGAFAATVDLRRLFPDLIDNAQARECARAIAGWRSLPVPWRPARPRPGKRQ